MKTIMNSVKSTTYYGISAGWRRGRCAYTPEAQPALFIAPTGTDDHAICVNETHSDFSFVNGSIVPFIARTNNNSDALCCT